MKIIDKFGTGEYEANLDQSLQPSIPPIPKLERKLVRYHRQTEDRALGIPVSLVIFSDGVYPTYPVRVDEIDIFY